MYACMSKYTSPHQRLQPGTRPNGAHAPLVALHQVLEREPGQGCHSHFLTLCPLQKASNRPAPKDELEEAQALSYQLNVPLNFYGF